MWRLITVAGIGVVLAGCATPAQQAQSKENLLSAAGFLWEPADTAEWKTALATLPPHKIATRTMLGKTTYYYADPSVCGCVYYGTPQNWAEYQRIVADKQLASNQEIRAIMEESDSPGQRAD